MPNKDAPKIPCAKRQVEEWAWRFRENKMPNELSPPLSTQCFLMVPREIMLFIGKPMGRSIMISNGANLNHVIQKWRPQMPLEKIGSNYFFLPQKWQNCFLSDLRRRIPCRSCTCCRKVQSTKRKSHPESILQLDPAKNNRILKNKDRILPPHKIEFSSPSLSLHYLFNCSSNRKIKIAFETCQDYAMPPAKYPLTSDL